MFKMMVRPYGGNAMSVFEFDKLQDALDAAEKALQQGFYRSPKLTIVIGEGSLITVLSDEAATKTAREEQEMARSGGLVQTDRHDVKEDDFVLHFQIGQQSLPPLVYSSEETVQLAIDKALDAGMLRYTFKPEHDYFFIKLGSGMLLFCVPGDAYLRQRREAVAQMQRMQAEAMAKRGGGVILTGR